MKHPAKKLDQHPTPDPEIKTAEDESPDFQIPPAEASGIRLQTHSILQDVVNWYKKKEPQVSIMEKGDNVWEKRLLFRKRLFNILKNYFLKPAYTSNPETAGHSDYCLLLRNNMLYYLFGIIQEPGYDQYVPPAITRSIFDQALSLDWDDPREIKKLLLMIRHDLKISSPGRKK